MKQVVLNIKEANIDFLGIDFVQIQKDNSDSKDEIISNLEKGFKELNDYKQGKLETTSAKDYR